MARRRMSPEQAQALAEKYRARYPDLSPREIMEIVTDPSLEGFDPIVSPPREEYKGFRVPPGSPEQQQRYKRAIDDRLSGFDSRQVERDAAARAGLARDIRSNIAGVVKPASMAASVTPYDLGLGDVGYAAGELIDPEGTYGDAMLAAGGGLLTAGLGSGAILSKAAKEARDLQKAAEQAEAARKAGAPGAVVRNPGAVAKAPMPRKADVGTPSAADVIRRNPGAVSKSRIGRNVERADDVGDLTPTVMYDNPLNFPKRVRGSRARGSTGGSEYQSRAARDAKAYADSMRTPPQIDPKAFNREMRKRFNQSPYVVDRVVDAAVPAAIVGYGGASAIGALGGFEGQENVSAGARGMGYQDMVDEMAAKPIDPNLSVRMMNEVRKTTDYGNAFAETTDRQDPMNFSSADELADLPGLYQENRDAAVRIFEQTGSVPSGMARSLGKYEALMNTRGALLDEESRMLREGISFKPSMPIVEDRTMMAGQGGMGREIEPAMGDQPMDTMNEKKAYGE